MAVLFTAMTMLLAQHGDHPGGAGHSPSAQHGKHGKHGNPEDLTSYVARMEDPERDAWQKPDTVIARLGLTPDSVVCDIGAGPGYFALRLAKKARHVFAVDVEAQILTALRDRIAARKAANVTPVLGLPGDPLIPTAACDVILVVDTFHHFPDGVAYLKRLATSLRPGGTLVNIDFHKRETPVGPSVAHRVSREEFLASAKTADLELKAEHMDLPHQYFLVLQPKR